MAKRKRAKSWDEYNQAKSAAKEYNQRAAEKIQVVASNASAGDGASRQWMRNSGTMSHIASHREALTPSVASWYRDNAKPASDEQPNPDDPEGNEGIRNNVLDAINGQLYGG